MTQLVNTSTFNEMFRVERAAFTHNTVKFAVKGACEFYVRVFSAFPHYTTFGKVPLTHLFLYFDVALQCRPNEAPRFELREALEFQFVVDPYRLMASAFDNLRSEGCFFPRTKLFLDKPRQHKVHSSIYYLFCSCNQVTQRQAKRPERQSGRVSEPVALWVHNAQDTKTHSKPNQTMEVAVW